MRPGTASFIRRSGAYARHIEDVFDGGWRWEDFFRGPGFTGLRKGTLTYGPPRRHVCKDGLISDDEWNRRNEARRTAVLEAAGIVGPKIDSLKVD